MVRLDRMRGRTVEAFQTFCGPHRFLAMRRAGEAPVTWLPREGDEDLVAWARATAGRGGFTDGGFDQGSL